MKNTILDEKHQDELVRALSSNFNSFLDACIVDFIAKETIKDAVREAMESHLRREAEMQQEKIKRMLDLEGLQI